MAGYEKRNAGRIRIRSGKVTVPMKITRSSQSASIPLRLVVALGLCLVGISLAATSFGSWEGLVLSRWFNSHHQDLLRAKSEIGNRRWGGADKSVIRAVIPSLTTGHNQ